MRVALASDVHLEFGHLDLTNTENADVLVLSGDICVASKFGPNEDRFFQQCSKEFKDVVYVMGNHEHYNGDFSKSEQRLREALSRYSNIHFLEKSCVKIDDVTFIGGTLWTDMNKNDDLTRYHVSRRMNDFQIVKNSSRMVSYRVPIYDYDVNGALVRDEKGFAIQKGIKMQEREGHFSPEDAYDDHKKMFQYIQSVIEGKNDEKFVVVGHHAPSRASTHPRYQNETLMNGAYSSELSEYILDHPQIKLWTHGHTHEDFDYMIGTTRVFCNPRGYINYEGRADNWTLKSVEI
jgi:predicted phosphodiesterase